MINVRFQKLVDNAVDPFQANSYDAGFDLVATRRSFDKGPFVEYGTGLSFEVPEGYAMFIYPRSSISKKSLMLCNGIGVCDSHYRGEVMIRFNVIGDTSKEENFYQVGDRIVQAVIMPVPQVKYIEVEELSVTSRGAGSFGSSDG